MSAWDVYWIMQMDTFRVAVMGFGIFASVVAVLGVSILLAGTAEDYPDSARIGRRILVLSLPTALLLFTLYSAAPSSKTLAAMYILPEIASEENIETIKKDFGDVYGMSIERVKECLDEKNE